MKYILLLFLFLVSHLSYCQNYDIRFNRSSINCSTRQVCYDVQLRPNGSSTFNLAGQNYRIFYNSTSASYTNGISLLPSQYGDFTLVQDVQGANADAVNGLLSFEATLGFLNYSIDLNDTQNGGIVLAPSQWTTTSNLCFNVSPEVINNPNSCIELVWGRQALTTPYATAFVEVSRWTGTNATTNSNGVLFDDLNSSDGDAACFNTACPSSVAENTIALCQDGIDNDGDGNSDCEDTDCLAISNLDCDRDGNPNSTDPNPSIPVAVNDAFTAPVSVSTNFNIQGNDDFLPGANTSITRTGGNAGGTVAFNGGTGNISYIPLPSEAGSVVTVNYQVCNTVPNPDVCATATISITVPTVNPSNDYNIRMVLKNVNCTTNQFCYTVQLSSANGNAMNLAGQNYRLYFDGSKMSYLSGTSLLPAAQYTSYTLIQNIENQNAGTVNGPLTFDDHLSLLNYTMDLNDVVNGGITLPANGNWVSTSELCFQGSFSVTATPMTCIEAVWGRNGLTNAYATAYVEVAKWISANNTQMAMGVNYDDITLNDTQNVCQVTDCDQDGNPNANDPNPTTPVAVNDAFTAPVGVTTNFNILSNDNFLPGANTSITRTGGNAGGTVTFNGSTGNISYTPLSSEAGSVVTVNYQVCNTAPNPDVCATATISITVPTVVNPSNDYNIRMVLKNVNCTTNQFCYTVQLSSANGNAMNLAGQNYRLYFDGSKMSYLSGTSLLPAAQYTSYTLIQNIENQNAGAVNGPLTFEDHLSFLNYTMDLNDVVNGGITLPANGSWVSTSELCFQGSFSVTATPMTCIEAVWGRNGLTNAYATAYVEVAKWISANNTQMATGVNYDDITLNDTQNVCQVTDCDQDGNLNGNDPNPTTPVAVNDAFTAPVGVSTNFNILSNDDFLPGANTSITRIGGNAGGTVAFNGSTGNISYTPLPSEAGSVVSVNYQVCNTVPNPDVCATTTISITVPAVNPAKNYNIRMDLAGVNCETNQFCYNVQLSSADGFAMNLAGQNYRLYWDGSKMSYLSGTSSLPSPRYTPYTFVSNTENQNAALFGTLPFDANLSFLNYTMDLNDTQNGGIVLPADGSWVTTSQLCFQSATDLSVEPLTCIEAVWGRDGLTDGYATAFVEVAEWESANVTLTAEGVGYEDITLSSQNNICKSTICANRGQYNIRMDLADVDCETNQFCYNVQLSSANGSTMNLAGQNYRLYWDGSKMSYLSGTSSLPVPRYTPFTFVSSTENQNASLFGTLPFDANLSFLNYTMDLNDTQNGGIVLPADGSWVTTSQLCFQSAKDLSVEPLTCIETVWGRDGLTNGYATAFVEVAKWESANVTRAAEGVGYGDITLSSQNNICKSTLCAKQGQYNIRMDLADVDCETNKFCYNVQLSSANGSAMNLAGQNYRLYWDGSKISYLSGTSSLPMPRYTPYTLVNNTENQNASVFGTLPFDAHLSFLNYTMDLNDTQSGGIILPADGSWITTSQLCFQSASDLSLAPLSCIEAVWGRDGLTNGYATAFVEVATWESANVTRIAEGVSYEDITLSSQNNICQSTACFESNIGLIKTSSYNAMTGLITYSYVVHNTGNLTLTNISVTEHAASFTGTGSLPSPIYVTSSMGSYEGTLMPGETATYTATYTVTVADINAGLVTNQALVSGEDSNGDPVTDLSDDNSPLDNNDDPTDTPLPCNKPVLTVGDIICNGTSYSVNFVHNGSNFSTNAGVVSGNMVINIPLGVNVVITSSNGTVCNTSTTVNGPSSCPTTCIYSDLTVGQAICSGATYSVSFSESTGAPISVSAGTRSGNTIVNIPLGTNVTITATNGLCATNIVVLSPANCADPCVNPLVSVGGTVCTNNNTTYSINYSNITGATVMSSHGTVGNGVISGIPSGQTVTITASFAGCANDVVVVPAPACICNKPVLTVGDIVCTTSAYSFGFLTNASNVTVSQGIVSGNQVINVPLQTDVEITASNGLNCATSITVRNRQECTITCSYPDLQVGQPICLGGSYAIAFSESTGAIISTTAGTIVGNLIVNVPINSFLEIEAKNGDCSTRLSLRTPAECNIDCSTPLLSIGGTSCNFTDNTYSINYAGVPGLILSSNFGIVGANAITGIPFGQDVILSYSKAGCDLRTIIIFAPVNCIICQKPVLTIGTVECGSNNTYSVNYIVSNNSDISINVGQIQGNKVINIPVGQNLIITASNGPNCATQQSVNGQINCSGNCELPILSLGQPICNSNSTYSVSLSWNGIGSIFPSAGII